MNKLTPNEVEILNRLAGGETVSEVAATWGRTPSLVYRTFRRARRALGARTGLEAIARWARNPERKRYQARKGADAGVRWHFAGQSQGVVVGDARREAAQEVGDEDGDTSARGKKNALGLGEGGEDGSPQSTGGAY